MRGEVRSLFKSILVILRLGGDTTVGNGRCLLGVERWDGENIWSSYGGCDSQTPFLYAKPRIGKFSAPLPFF